MTQQYWGIYKTADLFGDAHSEAELENGKYIRAIPELLSLTPFEKLRAAWMVLTGKCVAVIPPVEGELEETILKDSIAHLVSMINTSQVTNMTLRAELKACNRDLSDRIVALEATLAQHTNKERGNA